ncbi:hypothetical protein CHLRE_11g467526v5 [Chlamydomonas reinhardtii]|uniref:N-acetyltransferase domain-containing protein n=1 Tax=Chlamydomonas reinhardtii TaxID=3055 RepID=A0A2K3D757_CHLRE|nr:uncharacterized protein CHLRE_11g467526v5 [Chlamydomonas reinhardtii]PNW76366.1 hypothetical protein CHLRE_11g467526v5 [Chlamydomonas reinhardtii]
MPTRLRTMVRARPSQPTPAPEGPSLDSIRLRPGAQRDANSIVSFVLSEKINPLGLDPFRFTIAEAPGAEGIVGIVQTVPLAAPGSAELRTLVVRPSFRGRGLGSRLVSTQLEGLAPGTAVYLTTIESRLRFYKRLGFKRLLLEEAPSDMRFEVAAGLVAARLLAGQQLVVMCCVVQR